MICALDTPDLTPAMLRAQADGARREADYWRAMIDAAALVVHSQALPWYQQRRSDCLSQAAALEAQAAALEVPA